MDRLTSLTAFVRVVDSGGFSAAGRKLNMSTTTVSNHVQSLEDRLGARLLNRTTRKVSLTEVGQAYYDRCVQILADIEQADDIAGAQQSVPRGTLRIFTNTHLVQFLSPAVAEFLASYPEVKVDLTIGERNADLIDENYDLAVRMVPPPDSSLIVRTIATWRHVLCCSHGYIEQHGKPTLLADLSARNCMRHANYPYGDEWRFADRKGTPAAVRVSGNLISNSGETLKLAALAGVGVFLAAGFLVRDELESGQLVRLLPEYRPVELTMNAVYPHRHHLSAKVRTFIDLLVRHATEQQKLINPYS
ncbi:DNA-binding transcriptional LysR family regulator [Bradyrhizobium japonicum]|jgi:DNA-binding transcriptional LysR family regulator|uniref:DNA-binding transcriptional LysR family regulator n=1 Tax=Bradyrhizobium elkanii TaxID=29448 RepID=A0ABV4ESR4_BRAEL|nr:LysR family transcriptional regulator [Bradyrhizobium elkanii]MBP2429404.1 DNA-binding transcriptional LysR family regulator [Bradyrhizobium elkanii]MCP1737124.1 DNA-binding transcriptional LysR family regulator [Bradyrhizobium elkanii]MCP1755171.1 DNA-binding transcriptional LysR family regulator [Bradyrhizobium elkanii]MCP1972621.1 DNA-binding transcriptional LysR family regulator [Bradyrhizobium elkanii]MCP1980688.1 DNA-binding transcriptional LysR family regulator [Bradyrhizobium elkani